MLLRNVLYISYCLPASTLRPLVPDYLPLRLVGQDQSFLSIVIINCQDVHSAVFPFPRFNYNQLNLRAYVINPESGQSAVYFLKSGVTSPVISTLTRRIGIPWEKIKLEIQSKPDTQNHFIEYVSAGCWQNKFKIVAGLNLTSPENISPFDNIEYAINYLVRPLEGFFINGEKIGQIRIQHPQITPQFGTLKLLDFPLLNQAIKIRDMVLEKPHSVLFVNESNFSIYMPPRYIKTQA